MSTRIRSVVKRTFGGAPNPLKDWNRLWGGRVSIGDGANINAARLAARQPDGCSLAIGNDSNIECALVFEKDSAHISVGARTHVGSGTIVAAAHSIEIG